MEMADGGCCANGWGGWLRRKENGSRDARRKKEIGVAVAGLRRRSGPGSGGRATTRSCFANGDGDGRSGVRLQ